MRGGRARTVAIGAATMAMTGGGTAWADTAHPAGGVPTQELIPAAMVGTIVVAAVAAFGWAHRTGRTRLLTAGGNLAERITGLPPFAAVPAAFIASSPMPQTLPRNCTFTPAVWQARSTEMLEPAVLPR